MATLYKIVNGERIAMTDAETTAREAEEKAWSDGELARNMEQIRNVRNSKIAETDIYGLSDMTLSSDMKTYRKSLRDFPATVTNLAESRTALELDTDGSYKNFPTKPSEQKGGAMPGQYGKKKKMTDKRKKK